MRRLFAAAAVLPAMALAQAPKEDPVGLVLLPGASKLVRANTQSAIAAKAGDILFTGDVLRSEAAAASFLYCPAKTSTTLAPASEVLLEASKLKFNAGKASEEKPVGACFLPKVVRVAAASQQHYGSSLTRDLGGPAQAPEVAADKLPPATRDQLSAIDAQAGGGAAAMLARAAVFEQAGLNANALAEYRKAGAEWKEAVWIKGKIFEIEEAMTAAAAKAAAVAAPGGKTYALVFGVSKYAKLPQDLWLRYAHRDAEQFAEHLASPRGGSVPKENMVLLTDEKATTAAVRNTFQTFLKGKAGKNDTILILIAGHGTVQNPGDKKAYIVTHDSDPQDLASTALPMEDLQNLVSEQLTHVGRVILFVDVCRAGIIGTIKSTTVNSVVEKLAEAEGEIFGLMASRPKELSFEGEQWGNGHGAFSYYVTKGLTGEADKNKDGVVNVNEIIEYVRTEVPNATGDKQHPRDFGNIDNNFQLADVRKEGIKLAGQPVVVFGEPLYLASSQRPAVGMFAQAVEQTVVETEFQTALGQGRVLPDQPGSAFDALQRLSSLLPPDIYANRKNLLRIALEDRAQQVLLRYLTGDEIPQTRADFAEGAQYTSAAMRLTPESLYLQGRLAFFEGRAGLFDKQYPAATGLLEDAVRFDPGGAYSYNALGIGYLEQARYAEAAAAFRDATERAVHWAYPRHNLALTLVESGDYQGAIRAYQQAMVIAPRYSYLPYNLGLVYQRLNRRKDAERSYARAMTLAPNSPEPYNAMGTLYASGGQRERAETSYRAALQRDPRHLSSRHNLALLLAGIPARRAEGVALLRENLAQQPDYLPSRLSLAEMLSVDGKRAEAAAEYERVLAARPGYVAAYLALARLKLESGDAAGAAASLDAAARLSPGNVGILELQGDVEAKRGDRAKAREFYEAAQAASRDGAERRRIRGKVRGLTL